MDISIIIVNYNVKEFLENLLQSIFSAVKGLQVEIIVVDNASKDGSVEMLTSKFPTVKTIANEKNLGFAKANNLALKAASGKYFLLLNPDTILKENTLEAMFDYMQSHPEIGMSGCKVLNPDGTFQLSCRRGFPGPWTSFCKIFGLGRLFPKSRIFAHYNLTYLNEDDTYEVDAISGAFMFLRKAVYEVIGGFDEDFFMYGEDLDLCYRVQKSGNKVYYLHETEIIHFKGESTKRSSINETKNFYDAMRLFVRKHFASHLLIESILVVGISLGHAIAFLQKRLISILSLLLDAIIFNSSMYVAERIVEANSGWSGFPKYAVPIVYIVPIGFHFFIGAIVGAYRKNRISVAGSISATFISFILISSLTYFFKEFGYSRAVFIITYAFSLFFFINWRLIAKFYFLLDNPFRAGAKKALIVGDSHVAEDLANKLLSKRTDYYRLVGFISADIKKLNSKILGAPVVGTLENINKVIKDLGVTEVIFSTADFSYTQIIKIVSSIHNDGIEFKMAGDKMDFMIGKSEITMLHDIPLVDIRFNLSSPVQIFIKRIVDVILTLFFLPIFYIFKPFIFHASKNGNLERWKSSLFQVIMGKMSLVGPKEETQGKLYLGKKGITGLWNVEIDGEQNSEKLDIFYAKNQNIWLDLEILSKTFFKLFSRD